VRRNRRGHRDERRDGVFLATTFHGQLGYATEPTPRPSVWQAPRWKTSDDANPGRAGPVAAIRARRRSRRRLALLSFFSVYSVDVAAIRARHIRQP
jgi:hypothetical protein